MRTPQRTGKIGEAKIGLQLNLVSMFGKPGMTLQNIYVPTQNNHTSEIDLLFLTQKGLFVIESKYYSGYIFGDENQQQWTTSLYAGRSLDGRTQTQTHQFYNPIKQNQTHISALTQYLGKEIRCFSVIVFSDRCELVHLSTSSPDVFVCQQHSLHEIISHIWDTCPDILNEQQITSIYQMLQPLTQQDAATRQQHVQNIKQTRQTTNICPLCGSPLVQRTARNGPNAGSRFWGCSRFPSCRYTKSC